MENRREYPLPIKIIFSGSSRECGPQEAKKNSDIGTRTRVSCVRGMNALRARACARADRLHHIGTKRFFSCGFHPPVTRLTPYFFYIYIKVAKLRGHICRCGLLPYAAVAEKITASELGAPYRQAASSATPCSTSRLPIFSARSGNPPALVDVEPTARDLQTSSVITAAT